MNSERDRIYAHKLLKKSTDQYQPDDFVFDERVVRVFPDMIRRSVPGYGMIVPNTALLARRYAQDGTNLYDLGCSLGSVTLAMQQAVTASDVRIIAVDSSPEMIAGMGQAVEANASDIPVTLLMADICDVDIDNASVVVLNFTLQFIAPDFRQSLLDRIAAGMRAGGALILSEKIRFESECEQDLQTEWHHDFKMAQGYSELEVAAKRDALENVMKPDNDSVHLKRFEEAGFSAAYRWFQCFSFASYIAIK